MCVSLNIYFNVWMIMVDFFDHWVIPGHSTAADGQGTLLLTLFRFNPSMDE